MTAHPLERDHGRPLTVSDLVVDAARHRSDTVAVVTPEGAVTHVEILHRSRDLSARLVTIGIRKGTVVALLLPNSIEWVLWWVACVRIGAVVVPISTFSAPEEVERILQHSGSHVFVSTPAYASHAYLDHLAAVGVTGDPSQGRCLPELPQLQRVVWTDRAGAIEPAHGANEVVEALAADVVPSDVLTIIYSSGTTGEPKGVVHSHGATLRQAAKLARLMRTQPHTVLWTSMPLNWVGGLVWSYLQTTFAGGTFVTQARFDPEVALRLFRSANVNTVKAWGPVIERLRNDPHYDQSAFGHIVGLESHADGGSDRPSWLGMTETLGPHSGWFGDPDEELPAGSAGSMGQALPGVEHRIVDPETGTDLAEGEVGELLVRGDNLMLGLHRRERAETFSPDGWYRTRDAASLCGGWLSFHGRLDTMIKTSGANVSPAEVITVLEEQPAVRRAFVVGVPHPSRGEDVVAVVVADDGLDMAALRAAAKERLASYKVPKAVLVIDEDEVPWLASQKVDLRRLRSIAAAATRDDPDDQ